MEHSRTGRRPGDVDTRGEIVEAAREVFAERGYQGTTLREVAQRAGVDPALLHHYFGNKAGLFAAVGTLPVDPPALLAGIRHDEHAGYEIARRVLSLYESSPTAREAMIGMIAGAGGAGRAGSAQLRRLFAQQLHPALRAIVREDHADLRASLIAGHMTGVVLGRHLVGMPGLAGVPLAVVIDAVAPAVQHYVSGELRPAVPDQRSGRAPT